MVYRADITIYDDLTQKREFKVKNQTVERAILQACEFINSKDGGGSIKRFAVYLNRDFAALNTYLKKDIQALLEKKN